MPMILLVVCLVDAGGPAIEFDSLSSQLLSIFSTN